MILSSHLFILPYCKKPTNVAKLQITEILNMPDSFDGFFSLMSIVHYLVNFLAMPLGLGYYLTTLCQTTVQAILSKHRKGLKHCTAQRTYQTPQKNYKGLQIDLLNSKHCKQQRTLN